MHNKSKGKIRDTYLERKWRPTERSSTWARGEGEGSRKRYAKEEKQKQEEGLVIPEEEKKTI